MKWKMLAVLIAITAVFLSGCMYPEDKLAKNQIPYQDQIQAVQQAVNSFKKDNGGILPIKTKEVGTPIYQKYPIDFKKIAPKYLAEPPGNAYENGGIFQYVLVDAETNPTVKLLDLRMAETIRDINIRIRSNGYPPYKDTIADNIYSIDFKELGYKKPPYAISPYTNQNLPFVVTGDAEVFVDYRQDLFQELKNTNKQVKPGDDIRALLVEDSMFVPAFSLPYTIDVETNEPVFLQQ
jgi:hypothetical protein